MVFAPRSVVSVCTTVSLSGASSSAIVTVPSPQELKASMPGSNALASTLPDRWALSTWTTNAARPRQPLLFGKILGRPRTRFENLVARTDITAFNLLGLNPADPYRADVF